MYNDRNYCIFDVSELSNIDFNHVLETSIETVRKSVDGSKTFVKWCGNVPSCVSSLTTGSTYLTHSEIIEVLAGPEWTKPEQV